MDDLIEDFHNEHLRCFAVNDPGSVIEILGWRASVACQLAAEPVGRLHEAGEEERSETRPVCLPEGKKEVPVHRMAGLRSGVCFEGPAIVESALTTIMIDTGARFKRDQAGSLIVDL